jgi:hypothetical protein
MEENPDEMENLAVKPKFCSQCAALSACVFDDWETDAFDYEGEEGT